MTDVSPLKVLQSLQERVCPRQPAPKRLLLSRDCSSPAPLGWAQSQHDEKPKAIMGTFCETFLSQLARCVAHWKAASLVDGATDAEPQARARLGYTVQAAVVGSIGSRMLRQGWRNS